VDDLYTGLGLADTGGIQRNDNIDAKNGTNFAWAGSRSGTGGSYVIIPNLQPQVGFYTSQLAAGNPALPDPSSTLYTIWSGANDVFAYVNYNDPITPGDVAANIATSITNLYDAGGRTFLIPNLPPMGIIPAFVNDPVKSAKATEFVNSYNLLLTDALDSLELTLDGIRIVEVDIHGLFIDITNNPAEYGFTNVTQSAYTSMPPPQVYPYGSVVANPNEYLYWDLNHGTTVANQLIANAAYEALTVPEPSAGLLLLGGVLALGFCSKRGIRGKRRHEFHQLARIAPVRENS
jgi:phospholipase/lecithinase/hemolysin